MSVSPNMKIINYNAFVSCKYLTNVFLACVLPKNSGEGYVFLFLFFLFFFLFIETFLTLIPQVLHYTGHRSSLKQKLILMFSKHLCVFYLPGVLSLQWPAQKLNSYTSFGFPAWSSRKTSILVHFWGQGPCLFNWFYTVLVPRTRAHINNPM